METSGPQLKKKKIKIKNTPASLQDHAHESICPRKERVDCADVLGSEQGWLQEVLQEPACLVLLPTAQHLSRAIGAQAPCRHPDEGPREPVSSKPSKPMALGGRKPPFHTDTGWSVHSLWCGISARLSHEAGVKHFAG